ncbi:hypothetical protein, partial [Burkholderia cepacia]|uniref:hypothetical protein n=1 Tax=Burkholderia cepacia TaxID=292 RepID=UPI001C8A42BE
VDIHFSSLSYILLFYLSIQRGPLCPPFFFSLLRLRAAARAPRFSGFNRDSASNPCDSCTVTTRSTSDRQPAAD